jgi:hypothetical protein
MESMTKNNYFDVLEEVVAKAHNICNQILLFEAIEMDEDEVRIFLDCNNVTNQTLQDAYLSLAREYDDITSSREPVNRIV